jgi:transposase-like protein
VSSKGKRYDEKFKATIIERVEVQGEKVSKIAGEVGISNETIYRWLRSKRKKDGSTKPSKRWSSEDKFHIVMETYGLSEAELSAYCRKKGLYVDDIKTWRKQCQSANVESTPDPKKIEDLFNTEKKRTKELERELRNKEKALAETAALLVLRKKAQAIWGDPEDD